LTSRAVRARLDELGIVHRRGGYRDPRPSPVSWFGELRQRCIWREEFETLDEARE
jgi:putative transposase